MGYCGGLSAGAAACRLGLRTNRLRRAPAPAKSAAGLQLLLLIGLCVGLCSGEGNVGCLFSQSLCDDRLEWCFDDFAFGRCVPLYGEIDQENFYRHDLNRKALHGLEREMKRLFSLGYRWSHAYTQCTLQALLQSYKYSVEYDPGMCNSLADQDLQGALKAIEGDEQRVDPRDLAYVRFTPSASDPHTEFADEVYFPPMREEEAAAAAVEAMLEEEAAAAAVRAAASHARPHSPPRSLLAPNSEELPLDPYLREDFPRQGNRYPSSSATASSSASSSSATSSAFSAAAMQNRRLGLAKKDSSPLMLHAFRNSYNTPDSFRRGEEEKDRKEIDEEEEEERVDDEEVGEEGWDRKPSRLGSRINHVATLMGGDDEEDAALGGREGGGVYTEGGVIYLPEPPKAIGGGGSSSSANRAAEEPSAVLDDDTLDDLLAEYEAWGGFQRPERLDVKKPGPPFAINGFAFKDDDEEEPMKKEQQVKSWPMNFQQESENDIPGDNKANEANEIEYLTQGDNLEVEDMKRKKIKDVPVTAARFNHQKGTPEMMMPRAAAQKKELPRGATRLVEDGEGLLSGGWDSAEGGGQGRSTVDPSYAFLAFKDAVSTWKEGADIAYAVADLIGLHRNDFSNLRVGRHEVVFKVRPNRKGLNASEVAREIGNIKGKLKKEYGVEITSAGIGDREKVVTLNDGGVVSVVSATPPYPIPGSTAVELAGMAGGPLGWGAGGVPGGGSALVPPSTSVQKSAPERQLRVVAFLACGVLAATLIGVATLFIVRRHAKTRQKLRGLEGKEDTEASKDYQDLCRARMATKAAPCPQSSTTGEKTDPGTPHGTSRVASLSKEGEPPNNSPSSRSSTSSWSEEPALTNMDISTGHMVLSYMEDHLKNKDRLEQEWVALCAYEAEPCATTVAMKQDNLKKNRYPDIVPYDHSRVILNELANASGSDYINASTITDHDPRNPAYIATQGPLSHTAADFWQMVWEQGSVVMVMLTRLTEDGVVMSHRYWPEEGSELYHIYEVHLVSEHIWCDDYLVRSFYLKNLKTGETRTVTQFHFLSWPEAGTPLSTKALLEFRRKVNKSYRGRSCPIVVHCSDGVGRTGTYCLIDMVLNRMSKGAKEIDIAATLEHIRDQRPFMVKSRQQFEFVLMAVAEEVHAILRALPQ